MTACLALTIRTSLRRQRALGLALLGTLGPALCWSGAARADGAFPNALSILTPEQLPNETLLATNFGLVMSFDHDQTWIWSCEQPLNSFATLYQMGPPPLNRVYAVSPTSLITTDDSSCSWRASASGAVDAFVDPTNPNRVLAVIGKSGDAGNVYTVVESADAGTTFPQLRYTAAAGDNVTGVEIARSDPQTVYLTLTSGPTYLPKVAVTSNGGASWTLHDLSGSLPAGAYSIRLVSVDPSHPERLLLRVGSGAGESLATSTDSGASAATPLTFPGGVFTAFARMPSGSLIAGGVVGTTSVGYRSTDGGASFAPLPAVPFTFKAMSARGTTLYAALDNMTDAFAIETSADEGMTWRPLDALQQGRRRRRHRLHPGNPDLRDVLLPARLRHPLERGPLLPGRLLGGGHARAARRGRRILRHGRRGGKGRNQRLRHGREVSPRRRDRRRGGRHDLGRRLRPLRPAARPHQLASLPDRRADRRRPPGPPAAAPVDQHGSPRARRPRANIASPGSAPFPEPGRRRAK